MRASRRRRVLIGAAAAVPTALAVSPGSASAQVAPPPPDEPSADFCSTMLLTPQQLAAGELSTVRCFSTLDESLRAIGVDPAAGTQPAVHAGASTSADAVTNGMVLASHFDDIDASGGAFSVGGTACNGGGVSFSAGDPWNDRIRSTAPRGCSTVKHFSDANFLGTAETTSGGQPSNLGALAGRVSSMRYYA